LKIHRFLKPIVLIILVSTATARRGINPLEEFSGLDDIKALPAVFDVKTPVSTIHPGLPKI
jgi:hypothetical protein